MIRYNFAVSYGGMEAKLERLNGCLQHLNIGLCGYISTLIIDSSMTMLLWGRLKDYTNCQ